jgi:hypothetical protein
MPATSPSAILADDTSLSPGVHIRFLFGVTLREGVIVEKRGPLSHGRGHLFRIEFLYDGEPLFIELPASDFEIVRQQAA